MTPRTLKSKLLAVMAASYDTKSAFAEAVLGVLDEAKTPDERWNLTDLFVTRLRLVDATDAEGATAPTTAGVDDETWRRVLANRRAEVKDFVDGVKRDNPSLAVLVSRLLAFLDGITDRTERVVALALIVDSSILPYAQLPPGCLEPADKATIRAAQCRPRVLESLAAIYQLFSRTRRVSNIVHGLTIILAQHTDPVEREVIIGSFAMQLREATKPRGGGIMEILAGLGLEPAGGGCGNPDCPNCGPKSRARE